ncbi:MAG: PorT family protein [Duncaniella sp.]|nr:PorT family protein [Duncaniella sp.]
MKKIILFLIVMAAFAMPVSIFSQCRGGGGAVCGPAGIRFLEVDAHILVGGSYVTENYMSCFPEISDLNAGMGLAVGAGLGVKFNLTRTLGLGTGFNYVRNRGTLDMAVTGEGAASISNVFQTNTYYAVDFPVYLSYAPYIASGVRWNFDFGLFYSYGVRGKQKNTIYDAKTNDLGQLMTSKTYLETDYYKDGAFINSFKRADIGLHLATGITFFHHLKLGVRTHIGFKNVAKSTGLRHPSSHNLSFMAMAGWVF